MYGMTSYATHSYEEHGCLYTIEIRSQNHRFCDIAISLPPYLRPLEMDIRKLTQTVMTRGSIDISINVLNTNAADNVQINYELIHQLRHIQTMISGKASDLRITDILAFDKTLITRQAPDAYEHKQSLLKAVKTVILKCNEIRKIEGSIIANEIQEHLNIIKENLVRVREKAPEVEQKIHNTVKGYFEQWQDIDPQRMYQEIASLAVKASIVEEIALLEGHIQAMQETLETSADRPVGKRMDFLSQEMNREMHTIASKSPHKDIHAAIVNLREAVENIRELIRNVE